MTSLRLEHRLEHRLERRERGQLHQTQEIQIVGQSGLTDWQAEALGVSREIKQLLWLCNEPPLPRPRGRAVR